MFNWIKKILSGEQGATAQSPVPSKRFSKILKDAGRWLNEQNVKQINTFGLQTGFDYSQNDSCLTLKFFGGAKLHLQAQILGSFDPTRRTFLWAWANPSLEPQVTRSAAAIKAEGEALNETVLTVPEQTIRFDLIQNLMAFAAKKTGADGVYRAMTDDRTSVFMAFNLNDEHKRPDRPDPDMIDEAKGLIERHNRDMFEADKAYRVASKKAGGNVDLDLMDRYLEDKDRVYERDWRPKNDSWKPSSLGWPSEYDSALYKTSFAGPDRKGGLVIGFAGGPPGRSDLIYQVKMFEDGPKIINQLISLDGFIWPDQS